jgi:alpha-glucuronidase
MHDITERPPTKTYGCWLNYGDYAPDIKEEYRQYFGRIVAQPQGRVTETAMLELARAAHVLYSSGPAVVSDALAHPHITLEVKPALAEETGPEGFRITYTPGSEINISGADDNGVLYGVFELLRGIGCGKKPEEIGTVQQPRIELRIIEHWDNLSGDIERGYAGQSIFFKDNTVVSDMTRVRDYARLLASVGINAVSINNVNVHRLETYFLTDRYLPDIARIADIFADFGIRLFLSINYAAPIELSNIKTADPLDPAVIGWWEDTAKRVYKAIPGFGGFVVKADSENRPGPFAYGRDHAQGANLLARALKPYGGLVIWRCFVYNCHLDWRDRSTDRARAAYDNFKPLDGKFDDNVILQIKNGPVDFQVREPVSPLFGALPDTNAAMEFQITQEYTGQQKHVCFLLPMWREALDFDTYARGEGSTVAKVVDGSLFNASHNGIAGVSNVGDDDNWCGHPLAQANLYGFGRLCWNTNLTSEEIAREWVALTLGCAPRVTETVVPMLLESRDIYESYTAPLGVGWMVKPGYHYGPDADGYEYSQWGTYHYADCHGLGDDRTKAAGTGYTAQYQEPNAGMYEKLDTCPDALLLFFHHVPYTHLLKSGKSVIQHIYDSRFEGFERAEGLLAQWKTLRGLIDDGIYEEGLKRFETQRDSAAEWRDVINTYFHRKSGIDDLRGRIIYR